MRMVAGLKVRKLVKKVKRVINEHASINVQGCWQTIMYLNPAEKSENNKRIHVILATNLLSYSTPVFLCKMKLHLYEVRKNQIQVFHYS